MPPNSLVLPIRRVINSSRCEVTLRARSGSLVSDSSVPVALTSGCEQCVAVDDHDLETFIGARNDHLDPRLGAADTRGGLVISTEEANSGIATGASGCRLRSSARVSALVCWAGIPAVAGLVSTVKRDIVESGKFAFDSLLNHSSVFAIGTRGASAAGILKTITSSAPSAIPTAPPPTTSSGLCAPR